MLKQLWGRQIPVVNPEFYGAQVMQRPAIYRHRQHYYCNRCGQRIFKQDCLPRQNYYCRHCLSLGRISTLDTLISIPEPNRFPKLNHNPLLWSGQLSPLQKQCSRELLAVVKNGGHHLLWAVTGAGKTEMLFETLAYALQKQMRIGLASPRVDVCTELYPRIKEAFTVKPLLLHGKSEMNYSYYQLTICTTHQLLRFYQAFDLLIIDEVDSFPFAQDAGLAYAAQNACKAKGALVYLTATPGKELQKQVACRKLSVSYLPLRFHGYLLPEIQVIKTRRQELLPAKALTYLKKWFQAGTPFLIFVPKIVDLAPVLKKVKQMLPNLAVASVYAADKQRLEKVMALRNGKLQALVTTTILERGVTFKNLDLMVLAAEQTFSSAALVQIAGRVGRSAQKPGGEVIFFCQRKNAAIREAQRQIKFMNRKGAQLGGKMYSV